MTEKQLKKQADMKAAAEEFIAGAAIETVMKKYNVCYASVYNAIKKYNLDYKYTYGRTIFFNEDYFETIDTEEKAYWLGFIFADGSVGRTDKSVSSENRLTIGLSIKDKSTLEAFARAIEMPENKIFHVYPKHSYSQSEMVYLYCNSIKMINDLKALGCHPHKTTHTEIPDIAEELIPHFIRGYFDGDGCVSGKSFEITSDGFITHQMQRVFMSELGFRKTKIREYRNAFNLRYGGRNQLQKIFHYLYDNATVYMQRKYDKFLSAAFAAS